MSHTPNNLLINSTESSIKTWKYGESPMPQWVISHIFGDIQTNGTFTLQCDLGLTRVHYRDIVIERYGKIWVRTVEEADNFIENLKFINEPQITNIGPGKKNQYGADNKSANNSKENKEKVYNQKRRHFPPIGSQPSIEWIHLERLTVDSTYQRSTDNLSSRRLIGSIAAKFDWRLCAPLVVSRRNDDKLTIIDGQHRWLAACERSDIPQLPCCIFRYESTEEEARMFILANRARKPISRLDDYFAALAAQDEDALEIEQLVSEAGLRVAKSISATSWGPGEIAFTSSIAESIRRFGPAITSAVLTNMAVAFPNQKMMQGGAIFGGLVRIMSKPEPDFDPDCLVDVLQSRTAHEWGSYVAGLNSGERRAIALHDAIMASYNQVKSDIIAL